MTGTPPAASCPVITTTYIAARLGLSLPAEALAVAQANADAAPSVSQETADAISALLTSPAADARKAS